MKYRILKGTPVAIFKLEKFGNIVGQNAIMNQDWETTDVPIKSLIVAGMVEVSLPADMFPYVMLRVSSMQIFPTN